MSPVYVTLTIKNLSITLFRLFDYGSETKAVSTSRIRNNLVVGSKQAPCAGR